MFYVYILTNPAKSVLYTGHTECLVTRIQQHKSKTLKGFTARYNCHQLIWYEIHQTRDAAFKRERQIKAWKRSWKIELIAHKNPKWRDLSFSLTVDDLYDEARMHPATRSQLLRLQANDGLG